jgi:tricorn protease
MPLLTTSISLLALLATTPSTWTADAGLPQYPTLTPDGTHVVFSSGGDLWSVGTRVGSVGAIATRLTAHGADETGSVISPDGTLLAFESNRDGATNLYVMPIAHRDGRLVANGAIRRVTTSDRSQSLSGFSGDGRDLLFASSHEPTIYRTPRQYAVSVDGGPLRRLTDAHGREPRMSADGGTLVFTRGFAPWARPAYRGSAAREVWSLDLPTGAFRRISDASSNEGQTHVRPDGSMVLVSSRDGQNNLWLVPKDRMLKQARQLTHFAPSDDLPTIGHGVRDLSVTPDGRTAVFVVWDTIYTLDIEGEGEPQPLQVGRAGDSAQLNTRIEALDRKVNEAVLHPSGKAIAVAARGELVVRAMDTEYPAQKVTDDHARQGDVAWSPDGSTLYYTTDEFGAVQIHAATVSLSRKDLKPEEEEEEEEQQETADEEADDQQDEPAASADPPKKEHTQDIGPTTPTKPLRLKKPLPIKRKPLAADDTDTDEPEPSKTSKKKPAVKKNTTGTRWAGSLRFETTPVVTGDFDAITPRPSPDGRQLLYTRDRGDLVLHNLDTGEDTVLLESWNQPDVQWLPDGRHIVYSIDDLNFNTDIWLMDVQQPEQAVNLTRHPDIDHSPRISDDGKVLVFLSDRGRIGHNYEFDVYAMALDPALLDMTPWERKDYLAAAGKAAAAKKLPPASVAIKRSKAKDPIEFTDLDSAWRRVDRITNFTGSEGNLYLTPDAKRVLYSATIDGTKGLWSSDLKGKDRKAITSGTISAINGLPTGKTISMVVSGQAKTASPTGTSAKTRSIDVDAHIDVEAEQRQKFAETARLFRRDFYHPTMKGLNWDALTERYSNLAARTRTTQAFNRVVNEFFGEVNGSHTGIYGGATPGGRGRTSIGYLGIEAKPYEGGWVVDRIVEGSPAQKTDGLSQGDVITAINGVALSTSPETLPSIDLNAAMLGTSGKETLLDVRNAEGEQRLALLTPMSSGAWRTLAYEDEIRRTRKAVDELSDGRLGYLHIRGMSMPSVHDFERDLYAAAHGKDGLLIDVRDNGGGSTTDILLTSLTAPIHAYTMPRGADVSKVRPDSYPRDRRLLYAWQRPIAVLCNEHSFSNAEIFSHAIKTIGRGPLIGQETFGGVISTGAFKLIDGTTVRRPFRGWYLPDGTDMESRGAIPDVIVDRTPTQEAAGEDAQLQAAVRRLLRDLPAHPPEVNPKPAS